MIDYVLKWVSGIAVYLIYITLILQVVPKKFRKYISFFTGILLIMVVINPMTKLFDIEATLTNYFEIGEMQQQLKEMENMIKLTENVSEEKMIANYNVQIADNIEALLKKYGFRIKDIKVIWNLEQEEEGYGSVTGISIILEEKRTQGTIKIDPVIIASGQKTENAYTKTEIKEMKKIVADFYNIDEMHINIMIQG